LLPGHHSSGQSRRGCAPGSGLPARLAFRHLLLYQHQIHPPEPLGGPALGAGTAPAKSSPREPPRQSLLRPSSDRKLKIMLYTQTLEKLSALDRKSTRLNSSHVAISYAVFCLKKKNKKNNEI